jgi:hypothetical protein
MTGRELLQTAKRAVRHSAAASPDSEWLANVAS